MSFVQELAQLLDMGIPRRRAQAALVKSKGDVMSAAERVFGGDFDDVPSDDEDGDEPLRGPPSGTAGSSSVTAASSSSKRKQSPVMLEEDEEEELLEEEAMFDEGEGEERLASDPYAGIFFSKDRVERVFEPAEDERFVTLGKKGIAGGAKRLRVLGRCEWMSGCPEEGEQSHLFQLYSMLDDPLPCPQNPGHNLSRKGEEFFPLFATFTEYVDHLRNIVTAQCPTCRIDVCLACGEKVSKADRAVRYGRAFEAEGSSNRGMAKQMEYDELFHCFALQGVLVGMGLHMIEKAFAEPRSRHLSPPYKHTHVKRGSGSKSTSANKVPKLASGMPTPDPDVDSDDEVGITKGVQGTGYSGGAYEDRTGQLAAELAQKDADKRTSELLSQVRVYLPSVNRASGSRASDHLVHPTALAHLRRRSGFINDLLRNDSLLDMTNRGPLYRALFDWLEAVSSHESLASMLAMPQMRPASIDVEPQDPTQRTVTYEGSSSPRELLESCGIQAQAALRGLTRTRPSRDLDLEGISEEERRRMTAIELDALKQERASPVDDDSKQLEMFCERILLCAKNIDRSLVDTKGKDFVDRMKAGLPKLPGAGEAIVDDSPAGEKSDEAMIKTYEDWATKARFQYSDMTSYDPVAKETRFQHAYDEKLRNIESMDLPKRSLAIAKELAVLTRNLPVAWHSSIFLRVDEARVDCLKAMIIGPEGTPYENGCFIFDIFLPLEYNQKSPLVKSMTTNGGLYRYNPNLYADGKVCLSLLGTWSGPGWVAGRSTLLQVLISIQSLILCEEPYLNEPGWASDGGTPRSKAYSANVRRMVLADAIASSIKDPPKPFESEIKTHFRLKARYIRSQIERWRALDDGCAINGANMGSHSRSQSTTAVTFEKAAQEVKRLLDGLDGKAYPGQ